MNALVTGGTGFIGRPLTAELLRRGDRVRTLVRRPRRVPDGVEVVHGDIIDRGSLDRALEGVDVVYHLAGATLVRHPIDYRRINAGGTRLLAEACVRRPNPPVVVYLSSLAAAGPAAAGRPRTEEDTPAPISHYGRSKLLGERFLQSVAPQVPVSVLRAPGVFGPGDQNLLKLMKAARMGLLVLPPQGDQQLSWIYVDDLVEALLLAARRGRRLEASGSAGVYFVALEQTASLVEAARLAAKLQERTNVRILHAPRGLCLFGGCVIDLWNSLTGKVRLMNRDKMHEGLAGAWTCRVDRARDELGHVCQVSLIEGFRKSIAWYSQRGWL